MYDNQNRSQGDGWQRKLAMGVWLLKALGAGEGGRRRETDTFKIAQNYL